MKGIRLLEYHRVTGVLGATRLVGRAECLEPLQGKVPATGQLMRPVEDVHGHLKSRHVRPEIDVLELRIHGRDSR